MSAPTNKSPAVVITGASTGIGAACAIKLDRQGYRVFAGVRAEADGQRLQARASQRLSPVLIDVTDGQSIQDAARTVSNAVGKAGLAGLINNAGIVVAGPLEIVPIEEIRRQLEVNVVGQIAVTQAFLPLLRVGRGRIVLMGSFNGRISIPFLGPYSISKHALEAIADALRVELRNWGITVSLIEPCNVVTPIWEKSRAAGDELTGSASPEDLELYQADLDAMRAATEQLADTAMPVEKVVRVVVHALSARRPKTRYPVGLTTHLAFRAIKWAPDRLRDWFIRRELGLR